jgi:hypothetical protein
MSIAGFDDDERTILEKVEKLQAGYIAIATSNASAVEAGTYVRLRQELTDDVRLAAKLPDFVRRCRDTGQFWEFIKAKFRHYAERREYIWGQFLPVLDFLEMQERTPGVDPITAALESFDPENVRAAWQKALDRRGTDPEGAITAARALLETVCKHILDDAGKQYPDDVDLPKLYALTADVMNLAPHQHQESVFRAILGNCQAVVNHLGAIRNKIGDAHGQGRRPVRPKPRHAELAVNLAGTVASFLVATWQDRLNR